MENEEKIRTHATVVLHEAVEKVLGRLEVNGWFALPGGGNIAIVGDPDFSWITSSNQPHPKVIVRLSVTTCVLVVKPHWHRLSIKLGGRRI